MALLLLRACCCGFLSLHSPLLLLLLMVVVVVVLNGGGVQYYRCCAWIAAVLINSITLVSYHNCFSVFTSFLPNEEIPVLLTCVLSTAPIKTVRLSCRLNS